MGQYYMPAFISKDNTLATIHAHDFSNGLKLTEHSYIGNEFVNAALLLINQTPLRVAWIGDYSDDVCGDPYESILPWEEFMRLYQAVWDERDTYKLGKGTFSAARLRTACDMSTKNRYLVNHTKKLYIHLGDYIDRNKWYEEGAWKNGKYNSFLKTAWCIHPLPLLTACGNDRGGGDYRDTHPNFDKVGTWAFDLIEYAKACPKGYEPFMIEFTEQVVVPPAAIPAPEPLLLLESGR